MTTGDGEPRARPGRDIVVIGASAGGIEALVEIAGGLPDDFGAAVFVSLHGGSDQLATILERAGPLPAVVAADGAGIQPGRIVVASRDTHLVVDPSRVRALRGPKVNGLRPSVDVLFHSAARSHGARVIGVVLSGNLSDGTLGLRAIKRRGGMAIVQADPLHEGMPASAMTHVDVDAVLPVGDMAERLTMLVSAKEAAMPDEQIGDTDLEAGFDISDVREAPGEPSVFRCPDCGGALWELEDGDAASYVCHVGHAFSADNLVDQQEQSVERALWSAVRQLEEHAELVSRLGKRMRLRGQERSSARFEQRARTAEQHADVIRRALLEPAALDDEVEEAAS